MKSREVLANEEAQRQKEARYIETQADVIRNSDAALARRLPPLRFQPGEERELTELGYWPPTKG